MCCEGGAGETVLDNLNFCILNSITFKLISKKTLGVPCKNVFRISLIHSGKLSLTDLFLIWQF